MQRTSFWLTLPLIALAGFALSFYSPRGAHAGMEGRGAPLAARTMPPQVPQRELVRVSERPDAQEQPANTKRDPAANERR